jgi:hypothetical protein
MNLPGGLLRRHVRRRPQHGPGLRRPKCCRSAYQPSCCIGTESANDAGGCFPSGLLFYSRLSVQGFCESPVHDLHFAEAAHHDIGRLEVTVNHAMAVRERHCLADLLEDAHEPRQIFSR